MKSSVTVVITVNGNGKHDRANPCKKQQVTAIASLVIGVLMLTLFECLRGKQNRACRSLYRQRHSL